MSTTALQLVDVTKKLTESVNTVTLVKNISYSINKGEFISVTGPSGSGKSSLMYLMGLLDLPTSGKVLIDGADTSKTTEEERNLIRLKKIGFVFQFHFLLEEFTVIENVMLPMRKLAALSPEEQRNRASNLLKQFGINNSEKKRPTQLSGGERQRVAIARAMANDPLIILADEPSGNLDTKNADNVFKFFKELVEKKNKTVITITHDINLAKRADRIINIIDGEISKDNPY